MKFTVLFILCFAITNYVIAQDDLFGKDKSPTNKGFIIGVNFHLDFPAVDMAKR
jgi:hypothetical protein